LIRDLGYGESRESRSMFSEGKRILGATNARASQVTDEGLLHVTSTARDFDSCSRIA